MKLLRFLLLHSIHSSVLPRSRVKPRDMAVAEMSGEQREACERIAASIFADISNTGRPFIHALAAIYVSGLHHGAALATRGVTP